MGKIAFMFPGQGSQSVGMGQSFFDNYSSSKNIFETASSIAGRSVSDLCFNLSIEELTKTTNSQLAILTVSLAALAAFQDKCNIKPDYVLGHSLGEIAAYSTAGVLSLEDTFKVIEKRAQFMNEATLTTQGAMSAVIGADIEMLKECIAKVDGIVSVANYNSLSQIVITGEVEAVSALTSLLKEKGVRKVIPLAVSGAFHSELMKGASEKFADFVSQIQFNDAAIPVVTNVDACYTNSADDFKDKIVRQVYSSVRWTESIQKLIADGTDTFIEFGAGHVLSGLVAKIDNNVKVYNVSDEETLENVLKNLVVKEIC